MSNPDVERRQIKKPASILTPSNSNKQFINSLDIIQIPYNNDFQNQYNNTLTEKNSNTRIVMRKKIITKTPNYNNNQKKTFSPKPYSKYLKTNLDSSNFTNDELTKEYNLVTFKSKQLINEIQKNNRKFNEIKIEYSKNISKNNELKNIYNILLNRYKTQIMKNENQDSNSTLLKLQNENSNLIKTIKSKEKIINDLQKTIEILQNEDIFNFLNDSQLSEINYENYENDLAKINMLTAQLRNIENNINNCLKNTRILISKKKELENKRKSLMNENNNNSKKAKQEKIALSNKVLELKNKNNELKQSILNYQEILKEKKEKVKIILNLEKNNNVEIKEDNIDYDKLILEEKNKNIKISKTLAYLNTATNNITKENINLKNHYEKEIEILKDKIKSIQNHKQNLNIKNIFLSDKNSPNLKINTTIDNTNPTNNDQSSNSISKDNNRNSSKNKSENLEESFDNLNIQNDSYLYTITEDKKFLEFNIFQKKYNIKETNNIQGWDSLINEYILNFSGSLLLNTFQGLFILTGITYTDLYYYSQKSNTISKLKSFNYSHKYGALLLTPDNNSLLAIGGENSKNVEILNFETGILKNLPSLLSERINSAFSFIENNLCAFFGKKNSSIEYLNLSNGEKWNFIEYNTNNEKKQKIFLDGHTAIPVDNNEILIVGGTNNDKMIVFNFEEKFFDFANINVPLIDKVGEYRFDKDKYFNVIIGVDKSEINGENLSQMIGMDIMGNIHYFDNDFAYTVLLLKNMTTI